MEKYSIWRNDPSLEPPYPDNPVGEATIAMYKTVLRRLHDYQDSSGYTGMHWSLIWNGRLKRVHNLVKKRASSFKKKHYVEKVDHEFAPYQVVDEYNKIESEIWCRGHGSMRSANAWLRHRFCLLFSTNGVLRCESLFKAELSDFLGMHIRKDTDVHPIYLMIQQISTGKYKKCLSKIFT